MGQKAALAEWKSFARIQAGKESVGARTGEMGRLKRCSSLMYGENLCSQNSTV